LEAKLLQVLNTSALAAPRKQRNHAQHKYVKFCGIKQPRRAIKIIAAITAFGAIWLPLSFTFSVAEGGPNGEICMHKLCQVWLWDEQQT